MKTMQNRGGARWLPLILLAGLLAIPVMAADKPAASKKTRKARKPVPMQNIDSAPIKMDTIVVTGSLLPTSRARAVVSTSPVTIIDARAIQRSGAGDLASLLNKRVGSR